MRRLLAISFFAFSAACGPAPIFRDPAPHPEASALPPPPPALPPGAGPVVAIDPPVAAPPTPPPAPAAILPDTDGGGWPFFHGDAARTGRSSARSILSPRILWRTQIGIQGWLNAPVVAGGLVIVPSSGDAHNMPDPRDGVFALDLRLGKVVWFAHFATDANGAAVASDRVIATSDDGNTYALDLKTGKVLWQQKGQGKVYSNPLLVGDQAIVGDAGGYLRSYAVADGAPRWSVQLSGAIRGGASADGEHIYAASQGGVAVALSFDGKVRWRVNAKAKGDTVKGYAAPVLTERSVIIPFARDTYYEAPALIALSKKNGRTDWVASNPGGKETWGNIRSTPVLIEGMLLYAEPYSGDVVVVDAASGRVRYRKRIGPCFFPQYASPVAAGDVAYVPRFDGTLSALRPDNGAVLWQMYLGEARIAGAGPAPLGPASAGGCAWEVPTGAPLYAAPAIAADGTILIGSAEGYLYAIGDGQGR